MTGLIPVGLRSTTFPVGWSRDVNGCTSIDGPFAVAECACTGVHGANRLASNSLLEAGVR